MVAQPVIQSSFNSGEWAPTLYARVDVAKYHSGAALLRNFFVDYRGGASTRAGTRYILQAYKSTTNVRLIPFQASLEVGYVLEFGDEYIRFFRNGAPVLETAVAITGVTQANPAVVSVVNTWAVGDWVYITGVNGMTQLNGKYYRISARTGTTITLEDLRGNAINSIGYGAYTSGGTAARVYTLTSPYDHLDLATLKFSQNVTDLIICHPDYAPRVLTLVTAANWTLTTIAFGSTVTTPTGLGVTTTLSAGTVNYSYIVTAVDVNGQESAASVPTVLTNRQDIRAVGGTNRVTWGIVSGADSYNIYRADVSYGNVPPVGSPHGFIGNAAGAAFDDSNIAPDFSITPPLARAPFAAGAQVNSAGVVSGGSYDPGPTPTVSFSAPPPGGVTATGQLVFTLLAAPINGNNFGSGYTVGDVLSFAGTNGVVVSVATIDGGGGIQTVNIVNPGSGFTGGPLPSNPRAPTGGTGAGADFRLRWQVSAINMIDHGAGYLVAPTVTISPGTVTATAVAVLGQQGISNPSVPTFFQQRLVLAAPTNAPQTLFLSQPGSYYNFNISNPVLPGDSISGTLVSGLQNRISAMISQTAGLLVLSDTASWIVNGGTPGSAVTPSDFVANAQSFAGISDVPPIVANADVLYVQSRGSVVRNASYNFYSNVFTGTDISVLSSHLFYGYEVLEWAWAEEPFKVVWAIRDDGTMLTLTFIKEQEFIGWSHSDTNGSFKSVATITELDTIGGDVNAVYTVVERTVGGSPYKYIERFAERIFPNGVEDAWCVDSGLSYSGAPATTFSGGEHLAGLTVTGLADGVVITPFVMPASGSFTLSAAASKVVVGLGFTCQLQTLPLDTGEPTIQGKVKKVSGLTVRVTETLALKAGAFFSTLVPMKDLVQGNVSSMLTGQPSQVITDLYSGDARVFTDPTWTVPGQICIQQDAPIPATVLGVIPQITVGDTK